MNEHSNRRKWHNGSARLRTVPIVGILAAALITAFPSPVRAQNHAASAPSDLEIKAAFVLNFIRLVMWSHMPGERNSRELPVCALSKSDFFNAVRSLAAGKSAGNRPIVFKIETLPDARKCRALLLDSSQYRSAQGILSSTRGSPILTVGNGAGFVERGGMFELTVDEGKVQFAVGMDAIHLSGLEISARLLNLARNRPRSARDAQ